MASIKDCSVSDWLPDDSDKMYRLADAPERAGNKRSWKWLSFAFFSCFVIFASLVIGFTGGQYVTSSQPAKNEQLSKYSKAYKQPALRKEWRSLDRIEKLSYIEAVQCLKSVSSHLGLNQTLYDDFPWVHMHFGETSHGKAAFLAWHRYFIHTYEQKLRAECGYTGYLTYWDWTLDWENITLSPVWNNELGFGGNGNTSVGTPVFDAHCVTEGPFAGLEVLYFEYIYQPHCLLRGFDKQLADFGQALRPEALQKLLSSTSYDSLNLGLEEGPHTAIPKSINGDFSLHSAPFDPVFFLHHTQLDRIWWRWQQMDITRRLQEYNGLSEINPLQQASLGDLLVMGGLAPDLRVTDIMDTHSDKLRYTY